MRGFRAMAWGLTGALLLQACGTDEAPVAVADGSATFRKIVPTDMRLVREASVTPPPISGGTLLVSSDDTQAFVSDPDRDRVSIIELRTPHTLAHTVALQPGDEPGRLAQDKSGFVHVALRRGGAVVTIDPLTGSVRGRHPVCGAPRGIAYDAALDRLHVACAGGELVSLSAADGAVVRRVALGTDLRDVAVSGNELFVTRFKSAELLRVDAEGAMLAAQRPTTVAASFDQGDGSALFDTLDPHAAWRTVVDAQGMAVMLHQLARNGEIEIPDHGDANTEEGESEEETTDPLRGGSPYGGCQSDCSGVVQTEITRIDTRTGQQVSHRIPIVLAVDVAVSPVDGTVAIASAGMSDPEQPLPRFESAGPGTMLAGGPVPTSFNGSVRLLRAGVGVDPDSNERVPCVRSLESVGTPSRSVLDFSQPAVAVAYTKGGMLVVQQREPAQITVYDVVSLPVATVALGGASVYDTGHELFHRDAGAGMACASCHMEGGDDGHVWVFSRFGQRRTQALHVGLEGTAPFHWQGDMDDMRTLMEEVMVGRMGGVHQTPERAAALQAWVFELQPPAPLRSATDAAALRGQALFDGQAECNTCHSGSKLTNNRTVDVGTGEPLQVPALVGIAYRAPFIHNGCASTLRDRFDPVCGGATHGKAAQLNASQIDDLVAYLETL